MATPAVNSVLWSDSLTFWENVCNYASLKSDSLSVVFSSKNAVLWKKQNKTQVLQLATQTVAQMLYLDVIIALFGMQWKALSVLLILSQRIVQTCKEGQDLIKFNI